MVIGNHFSAIGAIDEDAIQEFIEHGLEHGRAAEVENKHTTVRWQDTGGPGVFTHLDQRDEVVCVTPCFHAAPIQLRFEALVLDRECAFCSGIRVASYRGEELVFPLGVQIADIVAIKDRLPEPGQPIAVRVAFFGEQVGAYADEAAYMAAQREELGDQGDDDGGEPSPWMAPQSLIPGGLFEGHDGSLGDCLLAGTVSAIEARENAVTGSPYLWARVNTLELAVEVVLDPADFAATPRPGMILAGGFWAVGTVDAGLVDVPRKRGLLERLRGASLA